MKFKILAVNIALAITLLFSSCSNKTIKFDEAQNYNMGTVIYQKVFGSDSKAAVKEVQDKMFEVEHKMTANANVGDIYNINTAAGNGQLIPISKETFYLLNKAMNFYKLSQGAFDITIGPIVKIWGIGTPNPRVPEDSEIKENLKLVNLSGLELNEDSYSARLKNVGQQVDLGAIAKGYAGDQAVEIYKKHKVSSAYIDIGGNVVVLGNKPDGSKWNVGVQNPRAERGNFIGILHISDKAVVTSGDYERFFENNGKVYHHIFDPKTGYPSNSDLMSTTIVADSSTDADALSTSTFVLGLDKGMKLVESLGNVGAIFITKDKNVYITDNLIDSFTFDDESKEYNYVKKR